jgi:hypothetical protein
LNAKCWLDNGSRVSLRQAASALINAARVECDRYVRERPEFFTEGTSSLFQLRQTLQQACRGYDHYNMIEAEPAIRQLLKIDFFESVSKITNTPVDRASFGLAEVS